MYTMWKGITSEKVIKDMFECLDRVKHLQLKPSQKVALITTYIMPHCTYTLMIDVPPVGVLELLDVEITKIVKHTYKLGDYTTS